LKNPWKNIKKELPTENIPCEYVIEVHCKGWFTSTTKDVTFTADERLTPEAHIVKWRHWKNAEKYEIARKCMENERYKKLEEGKCNDC